METPHYFSDCVADLEVQNRYPHLPDGLFDLANPASLGTYEAADAVRMSLRDNIMPSSLKQDRDFSSLNFEPPTLDDHFQFLDPALGIDPLLGVHVATEQTVTSQDRPGSRSTTSSSTRTKSSRSTMDSSRAKSITSASASPPDPSSPPPKKRRVRKSKPAQVVEDNADPGDGKRDKFLERNRVAASKCRQKKKVWVSELEDAKQGVERRHAKLRDEYNGLVNEVGELKNMLMSHAGCHNANIDKWIENEAKRFVESTNRRLERSGYSLAGAPSQRHSIAAPSAKNCDSAVDSPAASGLAQRRNTIASSLPDAASSLDLFPESDLNLPSLKVEEIDTLFDHMPLSMFNSAEQTTSDT